MIFEVLPSLAGRRARERWRGAIQKPGPFGPCLATTEGTWRGTAGEGATTQGSRAPFP